MSSKRNFLIILKIPSAVNNYSALGNVSYLVSVKVKGLRFIYDLSTDMLAIGVICVK